MMDIPVCPTCHKVIEPNVPTVEVTIGTMRYHASGDMSVTGEPVFYHSACAPLTEFVCPKCFKNQLRSEHDDQ